MTQDPDSIRADIEETRRRLGTNTDALRDTEPRFSVEVGGRLQEDELAYSKMGDLKVGDAVSRIDERTRQHTLRVIYSRSDMAHAEASGVRAMFISAGLGLLSATAAVTTSVWSILDTSILVALLLILAALIAIWLMVFGLVKARLVDAAARYRLEVDLMKAELRALPLHEQQRLAEKGHFIGRVARKLLHRTDGPTGAK